MEREGIALDRSVLEEMGARLAAEIERLEKKILEQARKPFNLNSPKQLGEILFDEMQLVAKPKKTRPASTRPTSRCLQALARRARDRGRHPGVPRGDEAEEHLCGRPAGCRLPQTGRVHTTFHAAGDRHRAAGIEPPEPAEHSDPHRAGARDPQGLRPAGRGLRSAVGRLLADRAARDGRDQWRRGDAPGVQRRARHPPRHRRPGARGRVWTR